MARQGSKHREYSSKEDQAFAQILKEHQMLSQGTSEVPNNEQVVYMARLINCDCLLGPTTPIIV